MTPPPERTIVSAIELNLPINQLSSLLLSGKARVRAQFDKLKEKREIRANSERARERESAGAHCVAYGLGPTSSATW